MLRAVPGASPGAQVSKSPMHQGGVEDAIKQGGKPFVPSLPEQHWVRATSASLDPNALQSSVSLMSIRKASGAWESPQESGAAGDKAGPVAVCSGGEASNTA